MKKSISTSGDQIRLAKAYNAVALVICGVLFVVASGFFTKGGGDYCDASYLLPDGSFDMVRDLDFAKSALVAKAGALFMALLTVTAYAWLLGGARKTKGTDIKQYRSVFIGAALLLGAYALVFVFAQNMANQSC